MSILDTLVDKKIINKKKADDMAKEVSIGNDSIETILAKNGVGSYDILQAKAESLGIPVRKIGKDAKIPFETLQYIPEESSLHYKIIPLAINNGVLEVGIVDPDNIDAMDALNFISAKIQMPYKLFLVSEEDFENGSVLYKNLSGEVTKALSELETDIADISPAKGIEPGEEKEMHIIEDAPVTKIVATVLRYATEGDASDIHIEKLVDKVRVRFRIDGDLHTSLILPTKVHDAVVVRIKILCNMKIDEKRKPQDGRFSARIEGRRVDFRVSTFPSYYGEKVVMRILDHEKGIKKLEDIGFAGRGLTILRRAMQKPYGLILISGPTGSGKSTTLYAMLNEINDETKNVLSLEDPVEYSIQGVSQSQVHPEIGYTFASGLRTTLRQDPDIIMVGEIRDKETAQLAIQAALTGHLVLSTIHTNTAIGAIPRLIDMGIDPYLIAPTLVLAMAQRLVVKLCPDGGKAKPVSDSLKLMIDKEFADLPEQYRKDIKIGNQVYEAVPTPKYPSGVKGRLAVSEFLEIDKEVEHAILTDPTEDNIYKIVRAKGFTTMKEDAIEKSFNKEIPFAEVNKL